MIMMLVAIDDFQDFYFFGLEMTPPPSPPSWENLQKFIQSVRSGLPLVFRFTTTLLNSSYICNTWFRWKPVRLTQPHHEERIYYKYEDKDKYEYKYKFKYWYDVVASNIQFQSIWDSRNLIIKSAKAELRRNLRQVFLFTVAEFLKMYHMADIPAVFLHIWSYDIFYKTQMTNTKSWK